MDVKPIKSFGFTANTGVTYYFGKKEKIIDYYSEYPSYIFLHLYAGVIYNLWKKGNISLTAGPALGIYNGHTQFTIGSCLESSYYLNKKIALTPSIILMKEQGADALFAFSIKATYCF